MYKESRKCNQCTQPLKTWLSLKGWDSQTMRVAINFPRAYDESVQAITKTSSAFSFIKFTTIN